MITRLVMRAGPRRAAPRGALAHSPAGAPPLTPRTSDLGHEHTCSLPARLSCQLPTLIDPLELPSLHKQLSHKYSTTNLDSSSIPIYS